MTKLTELITSFDMTHSTLDSDIYTDFTVFTSLVLLIVVDVICVFGKNYNSK